MINWFLLQFGYRTRIDLKKVGCDSVAKIRIECAVPVPQQIKYFLTQLEAEGYERQIWGLDFSGI